MAKNIIIIAAIFLLSYLVYRRVNDSDPDKYVRLSLNNIDYHLETARTPAKQSQGLMNRTSLCPNCGMIFIFPLELPQIFWMKNTLIPLDIIFIDSQGKIINIETAVPQPNTSDNQLTRYHSRSPAKYVIELNAGDASKISLSPGDTVDLSSL